MALRSEPLLRVDRDPDAPVPPPALRRLTDGRCNGSWLTQLDGQSDAWQPGTPTVSVAVLRSPAVAAQPLHVRQVQQALPGCRQNLLRAACTDQQIRGVRSESDQHQVTFLPDQLLVARQPGSGERGRRCHCVSSMDQRHFPSLPSSFPGGFNIRSDLVPWTRGFFFTPRGSNQ